MANNRTTGSIYEKKAADYLKKCGYQILQMNYRCRFGEVDIVARDGAYLVFAEVKYRASGHTGLPQEAVHVRKQRVIGKVAAFYCMSHGCYEQVPCRFDVVAILGEEISLIKDAFSYQGGNWR